MRSYAHDRERYGPLPYVLQAAPHRQREPMDWWPTLRISGGLAAVAAAGWAFLKLLGVIP